MGFKQTVEPVYKVTCDRCHLTKVIIEKSAAYGYGFREVTITIEGSNASNTDLFASVVLWLCEKCKAEFDQGIEPFIRALFETK